MISIAICDDDSVFLKDFSKILHSFFNKHYIDVNIKTHNNGKELLSSNNEYEFIFLDIDMPEITGTEVARRFRKYNDAYIIFVTNHDNMVYESIKYQPLRFLRKSKINVELKEVLTTIININNEQTKTINLKTSNGNIVKKINDIMYFDVLNHDITVHTIYNEDHVYGTLNYFEEKLKDDNFIRIQKSYLVNCRYIDIINNKEVILDNQKALPLSRLKTEYVKKLHHDYLRRN